MDHQTFERVSRWFEQKRYVEALRILEAEIHRSTIPHWNTLYLAGQAARFLSRFDLAGDRLRAAIRAGAREPSVYHALGVVLQQQGDLEGALDAFAQALELDPEHDVSRNSLGLTYRMMGRFEEALQQYDRALDGFCRRLVRSLPNERGSPIHGYRDTRGEIWIEKAMQSALYLAALQEDVETLAWPTGEQARREAETREHGGLLYEKRRTAEGKLALFLLPNYFDTFREQVRRDLMYAILLNNIGGALAELGRTGEARACYLEAIEFTPAGLDYPPPHLGLGNLEGFGPG